MGKNLHRALVVAAIVVAGAAVVLVAVGLAQNDDDGLRSLLAVLPGVFVAIWYSRRQEPGHCRWPWTRRDR
jgi:hypothetical protein